MKHYKVYLNLYKNNKRIEKPQKDKIILKLIQQDKKTFCYNKNKEQDKHYPIYYNDVYYFGSPIVLTAIREDKLKELLGFFKEQGLKFWITYLYEMFNFNEVKKKFKLKNIKMEINQAREYLFQRELSLVKMYNKRGYAIIQDNTEMDKIIKTTKDIPKPKPKKEGGK
jgi:hypothetical protein